MIHRRRLLADAASPEGDAAPQLHPRPARPAALDAADAIDRAKLEPLGAAPLAVAVRRAPYFVDAVVLEVERRYQIADLSDRGFAVFTTLHAEDQRRAEESIAAGIEAAEKGYQKGQTGVLQAALVSVDPKTGGILAYVGGRDYRKSQFDRASQAQRQAGARSSRWSTPPRSRMAWRLRRRCSRTRRSPSSSPTWSGSRRTTTTSTAAG
jgi:hypothetical protein